MLKPGSGADQRRGRGAFLKSAQLSLSSSGDQSHAALTLQRLFFSYILSEHCNEQRQRTKPP